MNTFNIIATKHIIGNIIANHMNVKELISIFLLVLFSLVFVKFDVELGLDNFQINLPIIIINTSNPIIISMFSVVGELRKNSKIGLINSIYSTTPLLSQFKT